MSINLWYLFAGLAVLIFGGELLVRGASRIALSLKISPLVVGLTIVAFGTSAPELLTSVKSALEGSPDIAIGNVVGSNIINLSFILGLTAVLSPIPVQKNSIRIDWPVAMGSALLLYFFMWDGYLEAYEGIIFLLILIFYTVFIIRKSRKEIKATHETASGKINITNQKQILTNILLIIVGGAGLYFGADWFLIGAKGFTSYLGVSERVIGLTVVAVGTSLPEMVTSIMASIRKHSDVALGNLIGSNIFNVLSILGITSIIKKTAVSADIFQSDMIWMLGISFVILPMMIFRRNIERSEGAILSIIYIAYIFSVLY